MDIPSQQSSNHAPRNKKIVGGVVGTMVSIVCTWFVSGLVYILWQEQYRISYEINWNKEDCVICLMFIFTSRIHGKLMKPFTKSLALAI